MPGEEGDDDSKRKAVEEKIGIAEDMKKNPTEYYHIIGSVEQMEGGGFRARFCILRIMIWI